MQRNAKYFCETERKRKRNQRKKVTENKKVLQHQLHHVCECECVQWMLHFPHFFCFVSIYCCVGVVSSPIYVAFSFDAEGKNRVSLFGLRIDMGLDSRPKICFALHVHTLYTHTLGVPHTHFNSSAYYSIIIISSIRVGQRLRLHIRRSIHAWEERFHSIFYVLSAFLPRINDFVDIFFLWASNVCECDQ